LRRAGNVARRGLRTQAATHREAHERLDAVRPQLGRGFGQAGRGALPGRRAAAGLIAWAYAREIRRTDVDVPDADALTGPALVDLMHGEIDATASPTRPHVAVTDARTGGRR